MAAAATGSRSPLPSQIGAREALIAELEARRRAVIAGHFRGSLLLAVSIFLAVAPFALLAWTAVEPAAGAEEPALRALARSFFSALAPQLVGVAVVAWPAAWIAAGVLWFRRKSIAPRARYLRDYKERVFGGVCAERFPGLIYQPGEGIHWRVVDESGLFPFASDVYSSEDRFLGRWGATDVCFAEAVAQVARRRGFGRDRETVYETYFRGIVFVADFNKHFHANIRLMPRDAGAARISGEQRIQLEDPRFEAVFQTWATDATNARYVLSLSLMERLTALSGRHRGLRARFHGGRLLLLLPVAGDLFEPSLHRHAGDLAQVERFASEASSCLEVVNALNLDTRIWSKR